MQLRACSTWHRESCIVQFGVQDYLLDLYSLPLLDSLDFRLKKVGHHHPIDRFVVAEVDCDGMILAVEAPWLRLHYGFISRRGRSVSPAAKAFMAIVRGIEKEIAA